MYTVTNSSSGPHNGIYQEKLLAKLLVLLWLSLWLPLWS